MIEIKIAKTPEAIDECLAIRHTVFVDEQNVPVDEERDAYDDGGAVHFLATLNGKPTGTGRLRVIETDGGKRAKIQRVAVLNEARGTGLGWRLMNAMRAHVVETDMADTITLGAQTHATGFYERLGYQQVGNVFDDAGIPHIEMRLDLSASPASEER